VLRKYFIDNPKRVHLTLSPKKDYLEDLNKAEQSKLEKIQEGLN